MPGYLADPATIANQIFFNPQGNISANNIQDAIVEVDNEKAPATGIAQSAVTNLVSDLSAKAPLASPTFTGDADFDSATLHIDSANNRVGIGTATPTQPLQVQGSSFLNGETVIGRSNSVDEGGQISFARASDNSAYWNVDTFGSTSTPTLRFFNDGTVKLQIDSSGRVNMPLQPSATVTRTSHVTSSGVIVFDSVSSNVGGHYNNSTGRFTCPVTGHYFVTFSCLLWNMGSSSYVNLRVNGSNYASWGSFGVYGSFTGSYAGQGASAIIPANANDYIDLYFTYNGTNLHNSYTWATFCLIK